MQNVVSPLADPKRFYDSPFERKTLLRVLVTCGSKRGGTEGIARTVGEALKAQGLDVDLAAPRDAVQARGFDAAIIGGGLYGNRWHRAARRVVSRRVPALRACRSGSSRAARSTTGARIEIFPRRCKCRRCWIGLVRWGMSPSAAASRLTHAGFRRAPIGRQLIRDQAPATREWPS